MFESIDVRKKYWVVAFARDTIAHFDRGAASRAVAAHQNTEPSLRVAAWLPGALRRYGLDARWDGKDGWAPPDGISDKQRGTWFFKTTLYHQLCLLLEMRMLFGLGLDEVNDQLTVLVAIAAHVDDFESAETLFGLTLDEWGDADDKRRKKLGKSLSAPGKSVGSRLTSVALQDWNQPLLGLPFHQFLTFADTRQLVTVAEHVFLAGGKASAMDLAPLLARGRMEKVHLVEAILALVACDGVVTRLENRLLDNVVDLARLTDDEADMVRDCLESPPTVGELATRITDPLTRRFAFETILVHSQLDGDVQSEEEAFIEKLADAFEIPVHDRLAFEAEAVVYLERHPQLMSAFSLGGLVGRFRAHLTHKVESAVKDNLGKLVTEIRETGDLAKLMMKSAAGELDEAEEQRVKAQLTDIAKTVPALAIFCVPGGSVLLPILMKMLPFDLMPSAFSDKEESL